jgi:hypothetical protein
MKSGYKLALFLFVTNAFIDEVQAGQGLLIRSLLRTMAWTILQTSVASTVSLTTAQGKGDPLR